MKTFSPTGVVAAEIRAEMARQQVQGTEIADRIGWSKSKVSRILSGVQPIALDEIEAFAKALDASAIDWLAKAFSSVPPDGGVAPAYPRQESNLRASAYKAATRRRLVHAGRRQFLDLVGSERAA